MYALEIAWIFFNVFMNLISFVFVVLVDLLYVRVNFGVTSDSANINYSYGRSTQDFEIHEVGSCEICSYLTCIISLYSREGIASFSSSSEDRISKNMFA